MNEVQRPLPQPTQVTEGYWAAANEQRLVVQCCGDCGGHQFYPRPFCLQCGSEQVRWKDASGCGTIYTFTVNYRAPNAFMKARLPYVVAMVDLDEGVRMMANILNADPAEVAIGKRVKVVFEPVSDEIKLPQFELQR
ncbi:Zn-ribbon domain-containing OB-fold protein [Cupriavidus oxalaticus]|uniref:Zn-ribbon domain-containing OB-fold protein n=1 Tax=Cupriavidus oxalaticus TaxID=96344 RepID=UPI003F73E5ED